MTLLEIVTRLSEFDQDHTVYAAEPWTVASLAIVDLEPDEGGLPAGASKLGLVYSLEIDIANEFLSGWTGIQGQQPDDTAKCQRLISYAVNDA